MNILVDQYNNTYHHYIDKKSINADYTDLNEETETNSKAPKFKVNYRARSKGYTENWSREIFTIYSVLKTNLWAYENKFKRRKTKKNRFKRRKNIGSLFEKELLLIIL